VQDAERRYGDGFRPVCIAEGYALKVDGVGANVHALITDMSRRESSNGVSPSRGKVSMGVR
jgi:hypothetical protein